MNKHVVKGWARHLLDSRGAIRFSIIVRVFVLFGVGIISLTGFSQYAHAAESATDYCAKYSSNQNTACKDGVKGADCSDYVIIYDQATANACTDGKGAASSGQATPDTTTPTTTGSTTTSSTTTNAAAYKTAIQTSCATYQGNTAQQLACLYGGLGQNGTNTSPSSLADCLTSTYIGTDTGNQAACAAGAQAGQTYQTLTGNPTATTNATNNSLLDQLGQASSLTQAINTLQGSQAGAGGANVSGADNNYASYLNGAGKQQPIKVMPCEGGTAPGATAAAAPAGLSGANSQAMSTLTSALGSLPGLLSGAGGSSGASGLGGLSGLTNSNTTTALTQIIQSLSAAGTTAGTSSATTNTTGSTNGVSNQAISQALTGVISALGSGSGGISPSSLTNGTNLSVLNQALGGQTTTTTTTNPLTGLTTTTTTGPTSSVLGGIANAGSSASGKKCPAIVWFNGGGWHSDDGTAACFASGSATQGGNSSDSSTSGGSSGGCGSGGSSAASGSTPAGAAPATTTAADSNGPPGGGANKRGYTVIEVTYRLGSSGVYYMYDDVLRGLRHVINNSGLYGIDPSKIAVGGDSAGGSLAMRVVASGVSGAKVGVGWSAPTNAFTALFKSFQSFLIGMDHSTCVPTDLAGLDNTTNLLTGGSGNVAQYGDGISSNDFSGLGIGGLGGDSNGGGNTGGDNPNATSPSISSITNAISMLQGLSKSSSTSSPSSSSSSTTGTSGDSGTNGINASQINSSLSTISQALAAINNANSLGTYTGTGSTTTSPSTSSITSALTTLEQAVGTGSGTSSNSSANSALTTLTQALGNGTSGGSSIAGLSGLLGLGSGAGGTTGSTLGGLGDALSTVGQVLEAEQYANDTGNNVENLSKELETAYNNGSPTLSTLESSGLANGVINLSAKKLGECFDNFKVLSPALFASPNTPPVFTVEFDDDDLVDQQQAFDMRDKVRSLGVKADSFIIKGDDANNNHGLFDVTKNHLGYDSRAVCPTLDFLDTILQPSNKAIDCSKPNAATPSPSPSSSAAGAGTNGSPGNSGNSAFDSNCTSGGGHILVGNDGSHACDGLTTPQQPTQINPADCNSGINPNNALGLTGCSGPAPNSYFSSGPAPVLTQPGTGSTGTWQSLLTTPAVTSGPVTTGNGTQCASFGGTKSICG